MVAEAERGGRGGEADIYVYGKASLESGEDWHSPTNALDRFFKVGVEMK
jgi:hypothetical protein